MGYANQVTPQQFVEIFRVAALQAGSVAAYLQGQVQVQQKPGESTAEAAALTSVDLAAQDVILHQLLARAPHVAVDAEEDTPLVSRFAAPASGAPLVVIDPIDGTLNYTRGSHDYAVMGALVVEGSYAAAVVAFPAQRVVYSAVRGERLMLQHGFGEPVLAEAPTAAPGVLVSPGVPVALAQRLREAYGSVTVSRCSAVDSSVVALGRAQAALSLGRSDRRRAIGYLLSQAAGGVTLHAERCWTGEDPELLDEALGPSITASSEPLAREVLALTRSFG